MNHVPLDFFDIDLSHKSLDQAFGGNWKEDEQDNPPSENFSFSGPSEARAETFCRSIPASLIHSLIGPFVHVSIIIYIFSDIGGASSGF
jgi:hypothetical protein